jgi:hypothetical protein
MSEKFECVQCGQSFETLTDANACARTNLLADKLWKAFDGRYEDEP